MSSVESPPGLISGRRPGDLHRREAVRWEHINRDFSAMTEAQALMLNGHFIMEHPARNRSGRFFNFNGTAGLWRRAAILARPKFDKDGHKMWKPPVSDRPTLTLYARVGNGEVALGR